MWVVCLSLLQTVMRSAMFVCAAACATIKVSTPISPFFFNSTLLSYFQKYHLHRPMSACSFRFEHAETTCVGVSDRSQKYHKTLDVQSCLFCTIMIGTVKPRSKGFSFLYMFALCRSLSRFQSHSQNCLRDAPRRLLNPRKSPYIFCLFYPRYQKIFLMTAVDDL
jgi:hypothetical protein